MRRSAESLDAAIGYVLGQPGASGVDYGMTRLSLGTVQSRFDGTVARSWIKALELDRYVVDAHRGCARRRHILQTLKLPLARVQRGIRRCGALQARTSSRVRRSRHVRSDRPHLESAGPAIRNAPPRLVPSSMTRNSPFHEGGLKQVRRNTDAEVAFRLDPATIRKVGRPGGMTAFWPSIRRVVTSVRMTGGAVDNHDAYSCRRHLVRARMLIRAIGRHNGAAGTSRRHAYRNARARTTRPRHGARHQGWPGRPGRCRCARGRPCRRFQRARRRRAARLRSG